MIEEKSFEELKKEYIDDVVRRIVTSNEEREGIRELLENEFEFYVDEFVIDGQPRRDVFDEARRLFGSPQIIADGYNEVEVEISSWSSDILCIKSLLIVAACFVGFRFVADCGIFLAGHANLLDSWSRVFQFYGHFCSPFIRPFFSILRSLG